MFIFLSITLISTQISCLKYFQLSKQYSSSQVVTSGKVIGVRNLPIGQISYFLGLSGTEQVVASYLTSVNPPTLIGNYATGQGFNITVQRVFAYNNFIVFYSTDYGNKGYHVFNESSFGYMGFHSITGQFLVKFEGSPKKGRVYFWTASGTLGYMSNQSFPFPTDAQISYINSTNTYSNGLLSKSQDYYILTDTMYSNITIWQTANFTIIYSHLCSYSSYFLVEWDSTKNRVFYLTQPQSFKYLWMIDIDQGCSFTSFPFFSTINSKAVMLKYLEQTNQILVYANNDMDPTGKTIVAMWFNFDIMVQTQLSIPMNDTWSISDLYQHPTDPSQFVISTANYSYYFRSLPCLSTEYYNSTGFLCIPCAQCPGVCSNLNGYMICNLFNTLLLNPFSGVNTNTTTSNSSSKSSNSTNLSSTSSSNCSNSTNISNLTANSASNNFSFSSFQNQSNSNTLQVINNTSSVNITQNNYQDSGIKGQIQTFQSFVDFTLDNVIVSSANKVPGGRKLIAPLFTFFVNLDDFWLYNYHQRSYDQAFQSVLDVIKESEAQKWSLIPFQKVFYYLGFDDEKYERFFIVKKKSTFSKFIEVENNSNGFFPNTPNFLFSNILLTFIIFVVFRLVFKLLENSQISVLFKEYSYWAFFLVVIFEGNLQYFSYILTFDIMNFYALDWSYNIANVIVIVIMFFCIVFGGAIYLLFKIFYPFECGQLMQDTENSMIGVVYLSLAFGIRNLAFGSTHYFFENQYQKKIVLLMLLEGLFMCIHFTALHYQPKHAIISSKTKLWLCTIIPGQIRMILQFTLMMNYGQNKDETTEKSETYFCFVQINIILIYGYIVLFIMTVIVQTLKTLREIWKCIKSNQDKNSTKAKVYARFCIQIHQKLEICLQQSFEKQNTSQQIIKQKPLLNTIRNHKQKTENFKSVKNYSTNKLIQLKETVKKQAFQKGESKIKILKVRTATDTHGIKTINNQVNKFNSQPGLKSFLNYKVDDIK